MPALEADRMGKQGIEINHGPRLTMAGRVGTEAGIVITKFDRAMTVDTAFICRETVIADKGGLKVRSWLLAGRNRHLRRAIFSRHGHRDAMARTTPHPDTLSLLAHMPAIMAAEATRGGLVTHIVRERLPGDSRLLEHQAGHKLLGHLCRLIDLGCILDSNLRVGVLVACLKGSNCGQSLSLVGILPGQQGQHLFLGKR